MALEPCLGCSQPMASEEAACPSCGQRRGSAGPAAPTPAPASAAAPAPASGGGGGALMGLGLVVCAVAGYFFWARQGAPAPAAAVAATPAATAPPSAVAVAPGKPEAEPVAPEEPEGPVDPNADAQRPPVPANLNPKKLTVYGVAYDLASLKPVGNGILIFELAAGNVAVKLNHHGWFRREFAKDDLIDGRVVLNAEGYSQFPVQEREPRLSSLSPGRRRGLGDDAANSQEAMPLTLRRDGPSVELDMGLAPARWPSDFAPAEEPDFLEPAAPSEPKDFVCRFYGIAYDALADKPLRRVQIGIWTAASEGRSITQFKTDGRGRYQADVTMAGLTEGLWATAQPDGYRPGLAADQEPALRSGSRAQRVKAASGLSFTRAKLPNEKGCEDGVVRFDLVAMPLKAR